MTKKRKGVVRICVVFIALILLFLFSIVLNINTGSVKISVREILEIVIKRSQENKNAYVIIWKMRLPRLLTAAVLGGALALSGFLLQTFFRNPIAGPYVLGVSAGAKMLLAATTILFTKFVKGNMSLGVTVLVTFLGAMLSMLVVLLFAGYVQSMSVLLVIGVMVSSLCNAATDFMINFANESQIVNLTHWSLGSFSGATWENLAVMSRIIFVTLAVTFCVSKPMSAYQLGEAYAGSVGVNIKLFRIVLILLSSLLSACVIAFAGPIAFVGIAVPHITKLLMRTARPIIMIPAVFLTGSIFCMLCDLVARTLLSPTELSLGTITSAIGAPIVIVLMLRQRKEKVG